MKKKMLLMFCAAPFLLSCSGANSFFGGDKSMPLSVQKNFQIVGCQSAQVRHLRSGKIFSIYDSDVVGRVANRINQFISAGSLVDDKESRLDDISSVDSSVEIVFKCSGSDHVVRVSGNRFIVPSFGVSRDLSADEQTFANGFQNLFSAKLEQVIFKVQDYPVEFDGFVLTFKGLTVQDKKEGRSGGSRTADHFKITHGDSTQELKIVSGQMPPPPTEFKVGRSTYVLLTFDSVGKERLYPDLFQVIKK